MLRDHFATEIGMINHVELAAMVIEALEVLAPAGLEEAPSSSSGLHHPPDERGAGGWILHAKRVFRMVDELSRSFELSLYQQDCLRAAAILHDLYQYGSNKEKISRKTDIEHPTFLASAMHDHIQEHYHRIEDVAKLIRFHSGIWGPAETFNSCSHDDYGALYSSGINHGNNFDLLIMIMHMADYIASRECVTVQPYESKEKK